MYLLVRAYFDQYGNFDGIRETFFGDKLFDESKQLGVSLNEICCRMLGYSHEAPYSAEERMRLRCLAVDRTDKRLHELLIAEGVKKAVLKENDILPAFQKKKALDIPRAYGDIVRTVANYIEHTDMAGFRDNKTGQFWALRHLMIALKGAKTDLQLKEKILDYIEPVKAILSGAVITSADQSSYAVAGKLVLPECEVDIDNLAAAICMQIGRRSFDMPAEHYFHIVGNMVYYQLSDKKGKTSYLKMVDLSAIYGMTIAQLIRFIGFSFVNQFDIYASTGRFIYCLPESQYLCVDPVYPDKREIVSYTDFCKVYVQGKGLVYA